MKPRTPIRKVSKARATRLKEYAKLRKEFLKRSPVCMACEKFQHSPMPATEIHHLRGRTGSLLNDVRYWIGVCDLCHGVIHRNPAWARELGLICAPGEWGSTPKTSNRRRE